ncbi:hypothetical protein ACFFRR_007089 [Megaselia abdita]
METTTNPAMKINTKKRDKDNFSKLRYLHKRISGVDGEDNEYYNFWAEVVENGGYEMMKAKIQTKPYLENYTKEELSFIAENLEIYKKCVPESISDEQSSIEDIQQPRAAIFDEETVMEIPLSSDSELESIDFLPRTNVGVFDTQIYKDDAKELFNEYKTVITHKIEELNIKNTENFTNYGEIQEKLHNILNLQTEYLTNEQHRLDLIEKMKDVTSKQNTNCKQMLRAINAINSELGSTNLNEIQSGIEQEIINFGQKKRLEIWKSFLRKQMDSLQATIANNMNLV